jgi:hypothetical protein
MVAFDTLEYAKELEKSGFPVEQAEALARTQAKILTGLMHNRIATKGDLNDLKRIIYEENEALRKLILMTSREH